MGEAMVALPAAPLPELFGAAPPRFGTESEQDAAAGFHAVEQRLAEVE